MLFRSDLIPGLHRRTDLRTGLTQVLWIVIGVLVIVFAESRLHD